MTGTLEVGRLLAAPGRLPAARNARPTFSDGRSAGIGETGRPCGDGRIALPAMVNAHDHGYGVRPAALGGADDALGCWIASFSRATIEPRLEVAGAFSCPVRDRNPWIYGDPRALLPYLPPADRADMEASIADAAPALHPVEQVEVIAAAHESELFQVQYGPIGPQWRRDATLERIAEASAANDRRVHMHLPESQRRREWLAAAYPQGIVRFLDDIGLLSPRPPGSSPLTGGGTPCAPAMPQDATSETISSDETSSPRTPGAYSLPDRIGDGR